MAIALQGSLTGREAEILGHSLGDVTTKLVGSIRQSESSHPRRRHSAA